MAGITDSLRIAMSGLQLAQRSLATTSNNVANVNTEGYTRKRVEQEARVLGGHGGGVGEVAVSRDVDRFLERQVRIQEGKLGRSRTVDAYARDVQGLVFGNPSEDATGLGARVDDLARALEAAATKPEDGARRSALVWAAQDAFAELAGAADQVQTLRRDADRRVAALVGEVNTVLQAIDDLNTDIVRSPADAALLDQRDRLVKELSYKLDVRTYTHDDNRIAIFAEDGQALLEYEPRVLRYAPAATMSRQSTFMPIEIFTENQLDPATGAPVTGALGDVLVGGGKRAEAADPADQVRPTVSGGELGGLLEVRDRLLPELDDQLQQFGRVVRHGLNAAHNGAYDASSLPSTLRSSRTQTALESGLGSGELTMAGTVYLRVDGGGAVNVRTVDLDAAQAAANPIVDIVAQLDAAPDLAAAFTADGHLEIATVPAGGTITIADARADAPTARAVLAQPDRAGNPRAYGFSHFFGFNDFAGATGDDPTRLEVRSDLAADPQKIASARLDVVDDGGTLQGTVGGVGDSRGLNELAGALDVRMEVLGRGGLPRANLSARDYLGDVTSIQAMRAANASRTAENDAVLAEELGFQKAAISGVNLDEEMAHLLQLQQAYSASARLLTAADEMLQELLNAKR
jgi:flagellar hook-associated protein 1 FlgK